VVVSGTASDNVGVRDVRVRVDSGSYATAATTNNWANWTINLSITATGSHTITANARDAADNFVTRGINITIGTEADTIRPSVAITAPANSSSHAANTSIIVQGTASDNVGVRDVRVRVDSGSYQTASTTNSWANWSTTITIPTTGQHRITVNARDAAGNFRTAGINVRIT
jgi:Bacterial Ig domain